MKSTVSSQKVSSHLVSCRQRSCFNRCRTKARHVVAAFSFLLLSLAGITFAQSAEEADQFFFAGKKLYESHRYAEALQQFQAAAEIIKRLGPDRRADLAHLYSWIGGCYRTGGLYEEALSYYERALAIDEELGYKDRIAVRLSRIGSLYRSWGRYTKALEYFQRALTIEEELGDKNSVAIDLTNIGSLYHSWGWYEKALEYYRNALAIEEELGDRDGVTSDLNNIGAVHFSLGEYNKALECFQRVLDIGEESGSKADIALGLNNIGILYNAWGRYEKAIECYERALAIDEQLGRKVEIAIRLNNIGSVYYTLGDFEKALKYYTRALAIDDQLGRRVDMATRLNNIGEAFRSLGRQEAALEYFERALAIVEELGDKAKIAATLNNIGSVHQSLSQYEQTLDYFQRALTIDEELGRKADIALRLNNIGSVYWRLNEYKKAEEYFTRAIDLLEHLRLTAPGAIRRDYLDSQIVTYRWLTQTYIRDRKPVRAFDTVELSSAKYLIEQMSEKLDEKTVHFTSISDYKSKIPKNRVVLNFANVNWSGILSRIYADRDRVFAEEIALGAFIADIDNRYGNRISRAVKIRKEGKGNRKPEKIGFDEIINFFRHLLAKPEPSAAERKAVLDIARALYDLLFSGLEEIFAGKEELLIVPGGILAFLPFEALIMPDAKYMVEKFHVMYAQSLTILEILEKRRYRTEKKKPLLAFGGAVYEEGSYGEAIVESEKQLEAFRRNTEVALSRGLSVKKMYDRLGYGTWRNLPGTLTEVKRIEAEVPGARLYTGQRVDESVVKDLSRKGELKDYRVIHFATHGLVVPEMPELSALVLSQMLNRKDTEDGYLRMGEIVKLDLEATFVNLSACETGLGKIYGGEGVVGLTQSFLAGGANGLSVSLWQVADESTMEFMVGMYRLANQEGMSYSRAITEMKRRFIRGKYPAPFYWAPFVYYGK